MTLARRPGAVAVALTGVAGHLIAVEADLAAGSAGDHGDRHGGRGGHPGAGPDPGGGAELRAASGRIGGSPWRCPRRRCPSAVPGMTSPWP